MRTALSPSLAPWRWTKASPLTKFSQFRPTPPVVYRRVSQSSSTAAPSSWRLEDLTRVSEETTPLIFHLTSDNPYHNLSIEHYLLTKSHPSSHILLFYTNRPCVVIGRNQNPWLETDLKRLREGLPAEVQVRAALEKTSWQTLVTNTLSSREDHARAIPIDLVRRRSGGGTVFHDSGNLNYSVIIPNTKPFKRAIHAKMVVRALSNLQPQRSSPRYNFADVRVNDRNDIVMRRPDSSEWLKVSGSAYKLTRGRALHHGTLLYSSPYLNKISDLLRSPGRDLIQAKGVESVRSKVGNLAWTADTAERDELKREITEAIIREFWHMYGDKQERRTGRNEVVLDSTECAEGRNPEIAAGVKELMSNAWRFEQTPRFDFSTGMLDGLQVDFHANRGVLEHLTVYAQSQPRTHGHGQQDGSDVLAKHTRADFPREVKLHEIQNWRELLTFEGRTEGLPAGRDVSDALVQRVEAVFPDIRMMEPKLESDEEL